MIPLPVLPVAPTTATFSMAFVVWDARWKGQVFELLCKREDCRGASRT